jgi:hypothetical protein
MLEDKTVLENFHRVGEMSKLEVTVLKEKLKLWAPETDKKAKERAHASMIYGIFVGDGLGVNVGALHAVMVEENQRKRVRGADQQIAQLAEWMTLGKDDYPVMFLDIGQT